MHFGMQPPCLNWMNQLASEALLFMNEGARSGTHFPISEDGKNIVGRGLDCHIVIDDPLCSREHASFVFRKGSWWVCDLESRNGTYVEGEKISEFELQQGSQIKLGGTIFTFSADGKIPSKQPSENKKTVVLEERALTSKTSQWAYDTLKQFESGKDLHFLFENSIRLLKANSPADVMEICLSNLMGRTNASAAGFLWVNDIGELMPNLVIPPEKADLLRLDESITELVSEQQKALRIENHTTSDPDLDQPGANSICVPLIESNATLGAIHLYKDEGGFVESDFLLCQAVAELTVRALVRARELTQLRLNHERLKQSAGDTDQLIGESDPMKTMKSRIKRIARATGCVLVRGESGAGKELVARALHKNSPRNDRPMLSVNCAAIPSDLMESQLFGHKKGAFTGADSDHVGWFEQADSGTLFLDEVGELNLEGQAKLLRILEGHPFLPVGSSKEVSVDVRVICATNRDLSEFVAEKNFREDLYYRLSVFEVIVPPLRERGGDIRRLIDHFLELFKAKHGRMQLEISDAGMEVLLKYQWPGNVRQLRNVIDSAVVMAEGALIQPDDLGIRDVGQPQMKSLRLDHWERELIKEGLSRTGGNIPKAAKLLGVSRATLYRKVEEYGIER